MSGTDPSGWPADVARISVEDLDRLGINARNELFWDGKRIEIRRRLDLTKVQKSVAIVVSAFAILGSLGSFVTGLNNASAFLCARGRPWLGCAVPANPAPSALPSGRSGLAPGSGTP
jgi:hypothetical protein